MPILKRHEASTYSWHSVPPSMGDRKKFSLCSITYTAFENFLHQPLTNYLFLSRLESLVWILSNHGAVTRSSAKKIQLYWCRLTQVSCTQIILFHHQDLWTQLSPSERPDHWPKAKTQRKYRFQPNIDFTLGRMIMKLTHRKWGHSLVCSFVRTAKSLPPELMGERSIIGTRRYHSFNPLWTPSTSYTSQLSRDPQHKKKNFALSFSPVVSHVVCKQSSM